MNKQFRLTQKIPFIFFMGSLFLTGGAQAGDSVVMSTPSVSAKIRVQGDPCPAEREEAITAKGAELFCISGIWSPSPGGGFGGFVGSLAMDAVGVPATHQSIDPTINNITGSDPNFYCNPPFKPKKIVSVGDPGSAWKARNLTDDGTMVETFLCTP